MPPAPRLASIFNTHRELVRAPRAAVWALFFDRSQWMTSFVSRRDIVGDGRTIGSRAEVRMSVAGSPLRIEEILHAEPDHRLVVQITAPNAAVLAHADFRFEECPEGCELHVAIHSFLLDVDTEGLDNLRDRTAAKLAEDFGKLRMCAERSET